VFNALIFNNQSINLVSAIIQISVISNNENHQDVMGKPFW